MVDEAGTFRVPKQPKYPRGEFSVSWWDITGAQVEELRGVDAETAVLRAKHLTSVPANIVVDRVIITDAGDHLNFEWTKKDGVTFPTKEDLRKVGITPK